MEKKNIRRFLGFQDEAQVLNSPSPASAGRISQSSPLMRKKRKRPTPSLPANFRCLVLAAGADEVGMDSLDMVMFTGAGADDPAAAGRAMAAG